VDALHYELHVSVDHQTAVLSGDAFITLKSLKNGLASVRLDLRQLTVSGVYRAGFPLAYSQAGQALLVTLDTPLAAGETATIEVVYGGVAWNEGGGGFGGFWVAGYPITDYSMGVGLYTDSPSMGRTWFPGIDSPCDKATCEIVLTTPLVKMGVATGTLDTVVVDSVAGTKTWYWSEDYPVSTYLMAMSIAKYDAIPDTADPRIVYYVHRTHTSLAAGTFRNVDLMMQAFEEMFGPYPYAGDKFSFVTTPLGDMEHQTCVFHSYTLMTGDTTYDDILSHELSHQWFGDYVTYGDWRDVWLSEGFASYCEALWHEWRSGDASYHAYVTASLMNPYLSGAGYLTYPIYDPDFLWGTVTYEKAGVILHMLRRVMGDALFFDALNAYLDAHPFGNAKTPDFVADCEGVFGSDLDWFFDEWIYQGGHPVFDWGWSASEIAPGVHRVRIDTRQVQTVGPVYRMPVDFRIVTAAGDTAVVAWVDAVSNTFTFDLAAAPSDVVFDPEDWLLDEASEVTTSVASASPALRLSIESVRPNPFNPETAISFTLAEPGRAEVRVYGVDGALVRTLLSDDLSAGTHEVRWDGIDDARRPAASGVYFCRLTSGGRGDTRKMLLVR
jgi:aminopeptidase N